MKLLAEKYNQQFINYEKRLGVGKENSNSF